jgi:hypothetical protein
MSKATLTSLSTTELLTLAAERGIAKAARMSREDLVAALQAAPPVAVSAPAPAATAAPAGSSSGGAPHARPIPGPDTGLPIPDRYGHDRLVLLVQDPQHVFAYWEVTAELLDRVQREAGEGATPVLVLLTARGPEQREIDLRGGNYYLSVAPAATYQAQIALRDRRGNLHPLATSNAVTTPAAVAASTAGDEAWMSVDETFHELLSLAGLPGTARDSSLARLGINESRLTAIAWKEALVPAPSAAPLTGKEGPVQPISSAALATAGKGPEMEEFMSKLLSSYNLSSHSLGSHSLSSSALVES